MQKKKKKKTCKATCTLGGKSTCPNYETPYVVIFLYSSLNSPANLARRACWGSCQQMTIGIKIPGNNRLLTRTGSGADAIWSFEYGWLKNEHIAAWGRSRGKGGTCSRGVLEVWCLLRDVIFVPLMSWKQTGITLNLVLIPSELSTNLYLIKYHLHSRPTTIRHAHYNLTNYSSIVQSFL
jgi:hypothetical protein